MSEHEPDPGLDLRAEIARIDRERAETRKLTQESDKFIAGQRKLISEAQKLDKERWWFPWLQFVTAIAAIVAAVAALTHR